MFDIDLKRIFSGYRLYDDLPFQVKEEIITRGSAIFEANIRNIEDLPVEHREKIMEVARKGLDRALSYCKNAICSYYYKNKPS